MDVLASLLADAWAKPVAAERPIGCCRVYVLISSEEAAKDVAKAAKKLGKIYQKKAHYGLSRALYVGYDNMDGMAFARGKAIVGALHAAGIGSCVEVCPD